MSNLLKLTFLCFTLLLATESVAQSPAEIFPKAQSATVIVSCGGEFGVGFFLDDTRHVLTTYAKVASGRPITVHTNPGSDYTAKIARVSERHGLALLELDQAAEAASSLSLSSEAIEIGQQAFYLFPIWVTHEDHQAIQSVLSVVQVGAIEPLILSSGNGTFDDSLNSSLGSPMLNENGDVIAVQVDNLDSVAAAIPAAALGPFLSQDAFLTDDYSPPLQRRLSTHWSSLAFFGLDQRYLMHGPGLSVGLVWWDSLSFNLRATAYVFDIHEDDGLLTELDYSGLLAEMNIGWRWLLTDSNTPLPTHFGFHLGASMLVSSQRLESIELVEGELVSTLKEDESESMIYPVGRLSLTLADTLELGAAVHFDVEDISGIAAEGSMAISF